MCVLIFLFDNVVNSSSYSNGDDDEDDDDDVDDDDMNNNRKIIILIVTIIFPSDMKYSVPSPTHQMNLVTSCSICVTKLHRSVMFMFMYSTLYDYFLTALFYFTGYCFRTKVNNFY